MPKVRVELSLSFPNWPSASAVVYVEASREALFKEATNKFKFKTKDLAKAALFSFDAEGSPVELVDVGLLRNGDVIVVTAGERPARLPAWKVQKQESSESGSGHMRLKDVSNCHAGGPLIDIGANLTKCSPKDLCYQLARSAAARVDRLVLTGCNLKGSQAAQRICLAWSGTDGFQHAQKMGTLSAAARRELVILGLEALPDLTFTAGVHPHDAKTCNQDTIVALTRLSRDPRCVAIGECGLDYDRMFSPQAVQLEWCRRQAELAVTLGKPLFLHERDRDATKGQPLGSSAELQKILQEVGIEPSRVCIHCFTGPAADLEAYVRRGYFIGLTGFAGMRRRGADVRKSIEEGRLPLGQLMLETDCPFMMPDKEFLDEAMGLQGRRMEPCALPAVCRAVAACYGVSPEEVARVTTANAVRFFSL